jgi:hypothetical protein
MPAPEKEKVGLMTNPDNRTNDSRWYSRWIPDRWSVVCAGVGLYIAMQTNSANITTTEDDDSWLCTLDEEFDMPFYDCEKPLNLGDGNYQNTARFDTNEYLISPEMVAYGLIALMATTALVMKLKHQRSAQAV